MKRWWRATEGLRIVALAWALDVLLMLNLLTAR